MEIARYPKGNRKKRSVSTNKQWSAQYSWTKRVLDVEENIVDFAKRPYAYSLLGRRWKNFTVYLPFSLLNSSSFPSSAME